MKVFDWNARDGIALVAPGKYVRLDSFDIAHLEPVRECYLKQYHYVACVEGLDNGLVITRRRAYVPSLWHGGVRPWEVAAEGGE
jgi:hypothetical protein